MKRTRKPSKAVLIESKEGKITIRVAGRVLRVETFKSLDAALAEASRILQEQS